MAPLLWLVRRATPRRGFVLGFAFGVAYFGAVLYWILLFGELAWIALVIASALFIGGFGALAPGTHADFAAYEVDPTSDPDVGRARPVLTVSLGREVFAA